jgi:hypothetical protein
MAPIKAFAINQLLLWPVLPPSMFVSAFIFHIASQNAWHQDHLFRCIAAAATELIIKAFSFFFAQVYGSPSAVAQLKAWLHKGIQTLYHMAELFAAFCSGIDNVAQRIGHCVHAFSTI